MSSLRLSNHGVAVPMRRNDLTVVDKDSIAAWEDAYRVYETATEKDVASASRAVAAAWRNLAAGTELPWWQLAAVHSAAEAFDFQTNAREAAASQADATDTLPPENSTVDPTRTRHARSAAVLPAARRPTNDRRVLAEATHSRNDNDGRTQPSGAADSSTTCAPGGAVDGDVVVETGGGPL